MRKTLASIVAVFVLFPLAAYAQNGKVTLDGVAKAMGAANLKSFELTANGMNYAAGQSEAPGAPWPRFAVKSTKRTVNYETASMRDETVQHRVLEPPRGGGVFVRGDQNVKVAVSGDHAWNLIGDAPAPAPIALAER